MSYNKKFYLLFSIIILVFILISFVNKETKNKLHQREFNKQYRIFSLLSPDNLDFSDEIVPYNSSGIWERLDKELLRNTYWQSNTLLYFKKANKYFPIIEPILEVNGIPDDFKYLALIESGLENVVSPSGAAGFWQFLKATGKEYNLEVNSSIDERYNLEKSTFAACEYLNNAYKQFGSWTMAAASYNMGMSGIRRAIESQGTNNYYNLFLNKETSQYVFRIIAIKEIMENPVKYGFIYREQDLYSMLDVRVVEVDYTIDDLHQFSFDNGINYKILKEFNPWLRKSILPNKSKKKYKIRIPLETENLVFQNISN
jgi:membrane-bound lytic murein transglycosylase D